MSIRLSIIIPSYNSRRTLPVCLDALLAQLDSDCELIIVDSSDDGTARLIQDQYPALRFERLEKRTNAAFARNYGASKARGAHLAFIDSDIVVPPAWKETVTAALPQLPESAVGLGAAIAPRKGYGPVGGSLHLIEFSEFLHPGGRGLWNCPSCAVVVSRERFTQAGGFPKEFDMAEDLLFNWAASRQGRRSYVVPSGMTVEHINRESVDYFNRHLEELGYWSARARQVAWLPGAWVTRILRGLSAIAAVTVRYRRIRQRAQASGSELAEFFERNQELIHQGLTAWSEGFRRGVNSKPFNHRGTETQSS